MFHQRLPRFIAALLLWLLAFLQLSSLAVTSVTIDEPSHVMAGYAFLTRGETRIMLNGPILANVLSVATLCFWRKGDVITPIHLLTILAGKYGLRLGVYNLPTTSTLHRWILHSRTDQLITWSLA
jgi:hypothetical protein